MLSPEQRFSLSEFLQGKLDQGLKLISSKDLFEWCELTGYNKNSMFNVYEILDEILPIFKKKSNTPVRIYEYGGDPMVSEVNWNVCELPLRDGQMQMGIIDMPVKAKGLSGAFQEMYRVLQDGAYLYCWVAANREHVTYNLLEQSGFKDLRLLTVVKTTVLGSLFYGLGNSHKNTAKYCILACKPPIPQVRIKGMRSIWLGYFSKQTGNPVDVEEDWIMASTHPFDKVLYLFSGVGKPFRIVDREIILVDRGFNAK